VPRPPCQCLRWRGTAAAERSAARALSESVPWCGRWGCWFRPYSGRCQCHRLERVSLSQSGSSVSRPRPTLPPTRQCLGSKFKFKSNCGLPSRPTSDGSESIGRAENVAVPPSVPLAKPSVPTSASSGRCNIFARNPSPYTVGPLVKALTSGRSIFHRAFYGLFASDGSLNGLVCGFPRNPSRYTVGPTGQCSGIRNNAPRLNACWRSPSSLFDAILHIAMADHRYLSGP
jgi:hypothetical protein